MAQPIKFHPGFNFDGPHNTASWGGLHGRLVNNRGGTLQDAMRVDSGGIAIYSPFGSSFNRGGSSNPVKPDQIGELYQHLDRTGAMDQLKQTALRDSAKQTLLDTFGLSEDQLPTPTQRSARLVPGGTIKYGDGTVHHYQDKISIPTTLYGIGYGEHWRPGWFQGTNNITLTPEVAQQLQRRIDGYVKAYEANQAKKAAQSDSKINYHEIRTRDEALWDTFGPLLEKK